MTRFSERVGARAAPTQIQLEAVNDDLRNSLWNEVLNRFGGEMPHWVRAVAFIARDLLKIPVDSVPDTAGDAHHWLRKRFFGAKWDELYDIVEFLVHNVDRIHNPPSYYQNYYQEQAYHFLQTVNYILERELSGYRFIQGVLVPVSDPAEVLAIEEAAQATAGAGIVGAHEHINAALRLLGQKPNPDYRNSIKESISGVESVVHLVGGGGSGIAEAVEKLAQRAEIHGALKTAIKQLYGYTSDESGIRHAILEQADVGYEEAKFMLITCSAFINYFIAKASKAGIV